MVRVWGLLSFCWLLLRFCFLWGLFILLFLFWFLFRRGLWFLLFFLWGCWTLECVICKIFNILFFLDNNNYWSAYWNRLIGISNLSQKSLFSDLESNSSFIRFDIAENITFFKGISYFFIPLNNFALGHGWRKGGHLNLLSGIPAILDVWGDRWNDI